MRSYGCGLQDTRARSEIAEHLRSRYGCSSGVLTEEGILTLIFCFSSILKEEAVMAHLIDCGRNYCRSCSWPVREYCVGFSELSSSPLQMGSPAPTGQQRPAGVLSHGIRKGILFEEAVAEKEENDLSIYADEVIFGVGCGDREKVREFSDRVSMPLESASPGKAFWVPLSRSSPLP